MLPLLPLSKRGAPSAYDDPEAALRVFNSNPRPADLPVLREYLIDQVEASSAVVLDVETTKLIERTVPIREMVPSVATLMILETNAKYSTIFSFWQSGTRRGAPLELLYEALDAAPRIVAYNGNFDLTVLAGQDEVRKRQWMAKLFDPFFNLQAETGRSFKLDDLLGVNGLQPKTGLGAEAPGLWQRREWDALEAYNQRDVEALAQLVALDQIWLPSDQSRKSRKSRAAHLSVSPASTTFPVATLLEQGTPAWLEARKGKITASLAPALLSLSFFQRRDDAFEVLLGEDPPPPSEAMARGTRMEPKAVEAFAAAFPDWRIQTTGLWVHSELPWLAASPDRLLDKPGERALLEVKVPSRLGPVQDAWIVQMTVQMLCTGRSVCYLWQYASEGTRLHRLRLDVDLAKVLLLYLAPVAAEAQAGTGNPEEAFAPPFDPEEWREVKQAVADAREYLIAM